MSPDAARLLVADDSPAMRRVICDILLHLGFRYVDQAGDGADALELAKASRYDLVITDWSMPRMTGIELLRSLRALPESRDTPVLIVTGYVTKELIIEAAEAGVTGFIMKPFVGPTLEEKVRLVLDLPRATQQVAHAMPTPQD